MLQFKVDSSALKKRLAEARRTGTVRREVVKLGAGVVVREALVRAVEHKDTGRYMRAVAEAGNAAGVGPFLLNPIGPSRIQARLLQILARQVVRWERFRALYEKEGRTAAPYYRKIVKNIVKAKKALADFTANREMGAPVFNAFGGDRMTSVRVNFTKYGGTGQVVESNGRTFVRLVNKEPHAYVVESRFGIMRRAVKAAKGLQVMRVTNAAYKKHLVRAGFTAA